MDIDKELIGASTGVLVLSVLAKEASYGYQIIKRMNDEAEGLFTWQEGSLYPVLHKLEQEGLVRSQWQQAETGRRRRYYYITAKGRNALTARAEQWGEFHQLILRLTEASHG
ncbi:MAG TPA: helix-turn-helix transcriptional regulator [Candidatus Hydrogenedentes bacterium]|nr:helix-turn-helix transcriptional regulator [Candidatus Hydrogenedentota bacterium]